MKRFLAAALLGAAAFQAGAQELVLYSGRSDQFVKPVVEAFTRATGVRVIVHAATSTALLSKLQLEGERTQADLYLSNDAGNLQLGSDLGLFQPLPARLAEIVPATLRAPDNTWVGLSARARVLVVRTGGADLDFIRSVFDLGDPRLAGRIAVTNSANESFVAGATVYMVAAGADATRDWLAALKRNAAGEAFDKHGRIVAAVADGSKDVGLVNHYYIFRHLEKQPDAPIRILFPDQGAQGMGVAWNVAGIAVSRYSQQRALAERFVEYLLSVEGQRMFAEVNAEYPTRPEVATAPGIPPRDSFKVAPVPMAELGRLRNATIDLIEEVGMP